MVSTRILTKKEIEGLVADIFGVKAQDMQFEVGGVYNLDLTFTMHHEHLVINGCDFFRVKE